MARPRKRVQRASHGKVAAAEHPGGGHAQLAEAETNFYKEHTDNPPHIHVNFVWPNWSGHVNTHFLTTEDAKVSKPWIIWWVIGNTALFSPEAQEAFAHIGRAALEHGFRTVFLKGIGGGVSIAAALNHAQVVAGEA